MKIMGRNTAVSNMAPTLKPERRLIFVDFVLVLVDVGNMFIGGEGVPVLTTGNPALHHGCADILIGMEEFRFVVVKSKTGLDTEMWFNSQKGSLNLWCCYHCIFMEI